MQKGLNAFIALYCFGITPFPVLLIFSSETVAVPHLIE